MEGDGGRCRRVGGGIWGRSRRVVVEEGYGGGMGESSSGVLLLCESQRCQLCVSAMTLHLFPMKNCLKNEGRGVFS